MSTLYLALGSNLETESQSRRTFLDSALQRIAKLAGASNLRVSSIYETPALLPDESPPEWNRPYWNLVTELQYDGSPFALLSELQKIETDLGRVRKDKWAPRPIDIDILFWEGVTIRDPKLTIPHPEIANRAFVLDPLAELAPRLRIADQDRKLVSSLELSRRHPQHQPRLMGIINVTPDSFSDGGLYSGLDAISPILKSWSQCPVAVVDIGAESTRPGAEWVDPEAEWSRLKPLLQSLRSTSDRTRSRPQISVDTRNALTAARAIELGADIINDVSHLSDPGMIEVLRSSKARFVLMHSLTVPADSQITLEDPRFPHRTILQWMQDQLETLDQAGISRDRIILDPGIGFGKTSLQSLQILNAIESFQSLGCPVVAGHSRKSFFKDWSTAAAHQRDPETLGVSLALIAKGIDLLRVHDPLFHHRAILAWSHIRSPVGNPDLAKSEFSG